MAKECNSDIEDQLSVIFISSLLIPFSSPSLSSSLPPSLPLSLPLFLSPSPPFPASPTSAPLLPTVQGQQLRELLLQCFFSSFLWRVTAVLHEYHAYMQLISIKFQDTNYVVRAIKWVPVCMCLTETAAVVLQSWWPLLFEINRFLCSSV